MKDYYVILEINEASSKEVIEKVHKLLIKRYHPDVHQDVNKKAESEEKMKEVNEAYEILSDPEKKKIYDAELKEYKIQQLMEEIRNRQVKANVVETQEQVVDEQPQENINNNKVSDDEIRRQAQVYYQELYRQYLYTNGYREPENFKTVAKRYISVFLTILVILAIVYIMYIIPYTNEFLENIVKSNKIFDILFGKFF